MYQFSFLQRDTTFFFRLKNSQMKKWSLLLNMLSEEYHQHKKESQKILRSYLNIVLFELERSYNPSGFQRKKSNRNKKIQLFEDLIKKHYIQKKLPSAYAEMLHVSPNYLNKICKEETGQTAGDLIRKHIIIEAQRLLYYSYESVSEIADTLGFESVSYFVTFFKKETKTTPEQFRKLA